MNQSLHASLEGLSVAVAVLIVPMQLVFPGTEVPLFGIWQEQLPGMVGLLCSIASLLFKIFSPLGSLYRATIWNKHRHFWVGVAQIPKLNWMYTNDQIWTCTHIIGTVNSYFPSRCLATAWDLYTFKHVQYVTRLCCHGCILGNSTYNISHLFFSAL